MKLSAEYTEYLAAAGRRYCDLCCYSVLSENWANHVIGKKHMREEQRASRRAMPLGHPSDGRAAVSDEPLDEVISTHFLAQPGFRDEIHQAMVDLREGRASPMRPSPDSLDAAWAAAEAALPEGWMGPSLAEQTEGNWRAYSGRRHSSPPEIVTAVGPSPVAALRSLAAKLRERQP